MSVRAPNSRRGYVALLTAIILSIVLSLLAYAASASAYHARFDMSDQEYAQESLEDARSCAQAALLTVAVHPHYVPAIAGDTVYLSPTHTCRIVSLATSGLSVSVRTEGIVGSSHSVLETSATRDTGTSPLHLTGERLINSP